MTTASLVRQLSAERWWGAIVGPHGSGKSSLLAELIPAIRMQGRKTAIFSLRDRQRRIPELKSQSINWDAHTLVVVDGFEQLGLMHRWQLLRHCRKQSCGVLITAHRDIRGFKTLLRTNPNLETVLQIVSNLTTGRPQVVHHGDVAKAFHDNDGNVRETLFDLYDLFQRRSC